MVFFLARKPLSDIDRNILLKFYSSASHYSFSSGIISTIISLIMILGNMNDVASIGPSMAYSFIGLFYGIILSEFIFKGLYDRVNVNSKLNISSTADNNKKRLNMTLFILGYSLLIYTMLLVSMVDLKYTY